MPKYKCKTCGLLITKEESIKYEGQCHSCFAEYINNIIKDAHRAGMPQIKKVNNQP